ncbi:MAG: XisH family protein [Calothrix sp. FI2-JRJ7]|nr:XisH family protein [Calothrix sp. FI2-JRJ7]
MATDVTNVADVIYSLSVTSVVCVANDRILYLAVPPTTYQTFFQLQFVQKVIQQLQIQLMIYDPTKEEILEWKK